MAANHYATLGVAPHSPREVIRAAYLKLMRRYHPDKNPSAEAAARVRAINAAYAVLSVAEERARYDETWRSRRAAPRPAPTVQRAWPHWTVVPALIAASSTFLARVGARPRKLRNILPGLIAAGAAFLARTGARARPQGAEGAVLIMAGAAVLVLVANIVPPWVVPEKGIGRSGVGGKTMISAPPSKDYAAATAIASDPALCSSEVASQSITRELFRRAARVPGSNPAALERISAYSLVRFASPVVHSGAGEGAAISCKARVVLHLPPGVTARGGRRSLDAVVAYSLLGAGSAGTASLSLTAEPAFVNALASLAETPPEGAGELQPPIISEPWPTIVQPEIARTTAIAPTSAPASLPAAPVRRPQSQPRIVEQHPSFSCSGRRNWAEQSVCTSASLAALDRALASLLADAMERGSASQRASLLGNDKKFIAGRNQCSSESCVRDAYLASMTNIRGIMSGAALPQ